MFCRRCVELSGTTVSVEAAVSAAILHARDTRAATGDGHQRRERVRASVACFPFSWAHGNCHGDQPDCDMKLSSETENLFTVLRQSAKPKPVSAIKKLIEDG